MKSKQLFIGFIIILLATTLLFPTTKEQKYCDQYSGESNADKQSDNFISCKTDDRCKVNQDTLTTKDTTQDIVLFSCIPNEEASSDFPK